MSQIGFLSSISTGRTNPSYDSMLRNSELMAPGNELTASQFKRNTKSGSLLQRYMAMYLSLDHTKCKERKTDFLLY